MGIGACGTIRVKRKFFPKVTLVDEVKRQPRGTSAWRANDSLLSMLWKDRKSILFLLSIHQPEQGKPAKRKVKRVNTYQEIEFLCPVIKLIFMWCYNSYLVYKHLNPNEKAD